MMRQFTRLLLIVSGSMTMALNHANAEPDGKELSTDCQGAPEKAVTELIAPVNQWANITCLPGHGHWLVSAEDKLWSTPQPEKNGDYLVSLVVSAIGQRSYDNEDKHKGYFIAQTLIGENDNGFVYGLWPENAPRMDNGEPYEKVTHYLIAGNLKDYYSLFFFINENEPEWVLSCHDTIPESFCEKATLIKVSDKPKDTAFILQKID